MTPSPASIRRVFLGASGALFVALVLVTILVLTQRASRGTAMARREFREDLRVAMWRLEARAGTLLWRQPGRIQFQKTDRLNFVDNRLELKGMTQGNVLTWKEAHPPTDPIRDRLAINADEAFRESKRLQSDGPHANPAVAAPLGRLDWINRNSFQDQMGGDPPQQIGNPVTMFLDGDTGHLLHITRRLEQAALTGYENVEVPWEPLREQLTSEVTDLFPNATIEAIRGIPWPPSPDDTDHRVDEFTMASLPLKLVPGPRETRPAVQSSGALWAVGGAWGAYLVACAFGWFALRTSIAYGDRHRRFTRAVTHELRTPLTTFRMYSEMLRAGMVKPGDQMEYFDTLEQESRRLSGLVDNVLSYARLEERRGGHATVRTLTLGELFEHVEAPLTRIAQGAGATLELPRLGPWTSTEVITDPSGLLQVLTNLVDNACKYGVAAEGEDAGAQITVEQSVVADEVCIHVQDKGPGIPPGARTRIFEAFERGEQVMAAAGTSPMHGVGLGLALSRALCRDLGGDLELLPAARGARFGVTIPRVRGTRCP